MVIKQFKPFKGQHCETTATGSLLKFIGVELSEPMLFGLGEGLGFIYWDMKIMDFPFIGGRVKPDALTQNLTKNLGLKFHVQETSSPKKAWENIQKILDEGKPVGLKLDCYHLDYFTSKVHFAGHYVAMYGYDDTYAYLVDTIQQGSTVKTTLEHLALARKEKGPMASKNLSYTIEQTGALPALDKVIVKSIKANAKDYLNPPITNIGYKGIQKFSKEILQWFKRSKNIEADFALTALLMERGGTGGALFRNLYRDFLDESSSLIKSENLQKGFELFCEIAPQWTGVAKLIKKAGETTEQQYLNQAGDILQELADKEKRAITFLSKI
ncbi:MAG: BtrH N-terminal domain-containing protein [Candidatus Kerfeldbacteria bacterium]|nr:BtrH N-terminal domain-containing protein [Candidatus Kerfeldbacteria bacterium]